MHASRTKSRVNPLPTLVGITTIAALTLGCTSAVWAVAYDWTAAVNGAFNDTTKWTPAGFPVAGDDAHFGLAGPYTVNFTLPAASNTLLVNSSNVVTFDMAGRTYNVGNGILSNAVSTAGTASLVVSSSGGGGTVTALGPGAGGSSLSIGAGSSLKVNNSLGSAVTFVQQHKVVFAGTLEVSGSGVFFNNSLDGSDWTMNGGSSFSVLNGATFTAANMAVQLGTAGNTIVVDGAGSQVTSRNFARMIPDGGSLSITSGGTWFANGQFEMGVFFGTGGTVTIGNGVGTSLLTANDLRFGVTTPGDFRSTPHMIINSGGIARARTALVNSFYIYDKATTTLNGGAIEIVAGGELDVADNDGNAALEGLLRGAGTISRFGAGSNYIVTNDGDLDVGDTTGAPGSGTAIGTITVNNGNLVQNAGGTTFFDFNPSIAGSADLIDINGGTATIAGTVDFDAIAGTLTLGNWDFLRATTILYTATDNMAAVLGSLTFDPSWQITFAVVNDGAEQVLRLHVQPAPEPSTLALLGLGMIGLAVRHRRRRQ